MAERDKDKDKEILEEAREQFAEGEDGLADLKNGALDDLRFGRLGDQWDKEAKKAREDEGRAALTINDIPASIRQVVNEGRQNRPQIKISPVDSGADVETAEVLGGIVKHIERSSHADVAYDTALDNAASMRMGYIGIEVDYAGDDTFEKDIKIVPYPNPLAVTHDAKTQAVDSSDWRYCFAGEMMAQKEFKRLYPKLEYDAIDFASDGHMQQWVTKDEVRLANWYKREETKRQLLLLSNGQEVMVVDEETYATEKAKFDAIGLSIRQKRAVPSYQIIHRLITGCDVLQETKWRGSLIPIVPVYGEMINEEGKWHIKSMVSDVKDAQRMFNLSRSTLTEIVGRSPKTPWMGPAGTFDVDNDKWENVNQKAYPYIEFDGQKAPNGPQRVPQPGLPEGLLQDILGAADDKKRIIGIHDANLGLPGQEISGRAIKFRQHQGDRSNFHLIDNLNRAIRGVGEVVLQLIPQVYTGERIARIIGADSKPVQVRLGPLPKDPTGKPIPPAAQPVPKGQRIYDITTGKYDVAVEAGPSYATRRQETAEILEGFMQAAPQAAPILGPVIVKLSDVPEGEKISDMLATQMPPAARAVWDGTPVPPPQPPPEVAMEQAKAQANFELAKQKAQIDAQLEQQRSQNKLEIERTQAMADIQVMREKAAAEMQIARERAQLDFELKRQEAALSAELSVANAAHKAATQGAQA